MSNSPLVNYTKISPNSTNPRNHAIDKITIHHMAAIWDVERCGEEFQHVYRQASANYGIGKDGRIGLYVEEKNRSWASANAANDNRAITIELSNDMQGGNWHVSDLVIARCIDLCVDICKRNNIKQLNFTGDANGNLTMHRYFASTACPGPYLASKFSYIADSVNKRLLYNEGDLTMTQYEELNQKIAELNDKLAAVVDYSSAKYMYNDDNMPSWARDAITDLQQRGALKGDENGKLNLSQADIRLYTILSRLNLFGAGTVYKTLEDVPDYAREIVKSLVDKKVIQGDATALNLTPDIIKILVYLNRAGVLNV